MNIERLHAPAYGKEVTDRLNEIIDWLNGVTDSSRVSNITVAGKKIVITYINGQSDTITTQDTTYNLATVSNDGLIRATYVYRINSLHEQIDTLNVACAAIEKANEAIDNIPDPSVDDGGGGGDGDGGGGDADSGGDDGGQGGGGGDF